MKYFALLVLLLFGTALSAQEMAPVPEIPFRVVDDFLKIPSDMIMAEAVGVAINSKGHIFILNRGNHPLLEFSADGDFIGSFGEGSPIFRVPHSIRFDSQDNMWFVNSADNLVVKFNPRRRVEQALGRREEPWVYLTHGIERAIPAPASFYQPTDTVVGPDGSTYVTDGYGNSGHIQAGMAAGWSGMVAVHHPGAHAGHFRGKRRQGVQTRLERQSAGQIRETWQAAGMVRFSPCTDVPG